MDLNGISRVIPQKKFRICGINKKCWKRLSNSFFFNPCAFTASFSKEIQFSPTHFTCFVEYNRFNVWRGNRKGPFYAHAIRNFSNGECSGATLTLTLNYIAFKALDSFLASFYDFIVHGNVVSSLKLWEVVRWG